MARTSRQDRRQRRAEAAGLPPIRPATRQRPVEEKRDDRPVEPTGAESAAGGRRGIPGIRFIQESWAELKKVEWPTQQQVVSGTAVVVVACVIVGVYLYANDRLWSYVVQHIL
jgi:preprotein translocase subunit SecE